MTQKAKIIQMLRESEWTCTSKMYAAFLADPRTILARMKNHQGYDLEWRWCRTHPHKMKEWKLNEKKPAYEVIGRREEGAEQKQGQFNAI